MWEGWNPVEDIKNEWAATKSIWGQIKVVLFFGGLWLGLLGCIYMFFVPSAIGYECLAADEAGAAIRLWTLYMVAFCLFVIRDGTKLPNLRFLVGVIILHYATIYWYRDSMDSDCFDTITKNAGSDIGGVLIIMICAYVERRVDGNTGGTTGETTPLTE